MRRWYASPTTAKDGKFAGLFTKATWPVLGRSGELVGCCVAALLTSAGPDPFALACFAFVRKRAQDAQPAGSAWWMIRFCTLKPLFARLWTSRGGCDWLNNDVM